MTLRYVPVHPMKTIVETNNFRDFLGIFQFKVCTEDHTLSKKLQKFTQVELLEYLRRLHEDISIATYQFNEYLNPKLLMAVVISLIVLILHIYSIIIYIGFDISTTPETDMINILNYVSMIMHTMGPFFLFRAAQQYKNIVS